MNRHRETIVPMLIAIYFIDSELGQKLMTYGMGRQYRGKLWDYPQITHAPLFLSIIVDPEKGSNIFLEKYTFLVVCHKLPKISYAMNYKVINS